MSNFVSLLRLLFGYCGCACFLSTLLIKSKSVQNLINLELEILISVLPPLFPCVPL